MHLRIIVSTEYTQRRPRKRISSNNLKLSKKEILWKVIDIKYRKSLSRSWSVEGNNDTTAVFKKNNLTHLCPILGSCLRDHHILTRSSYSFPAIPTGLLACPLINQTLILPLIHDTYLQLWHVKFQVHKVFCAFSHADPHSCNNSPLYTPVYHIILENPT